MLTTSLILLSVALSPPLREWPVVDVLDVYDGDTATVTLDIGLDTHVVRTVRLFGIDTPEIRPLKSRAAGIAARDWLHDRLDACGDDLRVVTGTKNGRAQVGKFGRLLVRFRCGDVDLADEMIERGLGRQYYGGAK